MNNGRSDTQRRRDIQRNRLRRQLKRTPGSPTFDESYLFAHDLRTATADAKAERRR